MKPSLLGSNFSILSSHVLLHTVIVFNQFLQIRKARMVEAAAEQLKISVKQFLEDAREGRVEFDVPDLMVTQHQKFLDFLTGKWAEGTEARARTRSVKEGMEQQIRLVGSKAIYDRVSRSLARLDNTSDPFFIKEQLLLFKWRVEFIGKFFPIEAAVAQYYSRALYIWDPSPGWWHCFGAGALPGQPGGGNDCYPQFALAGMAFDWVLHQAFHIGENVVQFSQAFQEVPPEMRSSLEPESIFAIYGGDYDYKYWLFYDDQADEEHAFKYVHSVSDYAIRDGEGMPLSYLRQVVWALHSKGPPSLTELAIKRVLELELPLEDLPEDVLDMIEEGPVSRPLAERGVHLVEVLEQKEKDEMVKKLKEEEEEMAFMLAEEEETETDAEECLEEEDEVTDNSEEEDI